MVKTPQQTDIGNHEDRSSDFGHGPARFGKLKTLYDEAGHQDGHKGQERPGQDVEGPSRVVSEGGAAFGTHQIVGEVRDPVGDQKRQDSTNHRVTRGMGAGRLQQPVQFASGRDQGEHRHHEPERKPGREPFIQAERK
jgi:hypothetical protein